MQLLSYKPLLTLEALAGPSVKVLSHSRIKSLDAHALRIGILLGLIVLLNLVDLAYTLYAHRAGQLNELNPIAANLFELDLEQGVVCLKALSLLVGISLLWRLRNNPWTAGGCWALVTVYTLLTFQWICWMHMYTESMRIQATYQMPYILQVP